MGIRPRIFRTCAKNHSQKCEKRGARRDSQRRAALDVVGAIFTTSSLARRCRPNFHNVKPRPTLSAKLSQRRASPDAVGPVFTTSSLARRCRPYFHNVEPRPTLSAQFSQRQASPDVVGPIFTTSSLARRCRPYFHNVEPRPTLSAKISQRQASLDVVGPIFTTSSRARRCRPYFHKICAWRKRPEVMVLHPWILAHDSGTVRDGRTGFRTIAGKDAGEIGRPLKAYGSCR